MVLNLIQHTVLALNLYFHTMLRLKLPFIHLDHD